MTIGETELQVLLAIYQEVGLHLRHADDKRDRLFEIYVTIMLATATGLGVLRLTVSPLPREIAVLAIVFIVILATLGESVLFAMVGARKWHAEYVNCYIILNTMISMGVLDVHPGLVPPQRRHGFVGSLFASRVFVLVQTCIAGTWLMAGDLLSATQIGNAAYGAAGVVALCMVVVHRILAARLLRGAERRFWDDPRTSWVFSGIQFPGVSPSGDDDAGSDNGH